jgi:type I restriction enzyme R subunit
MATQSEAILENNLIKQLIGLGYQSVQIHDAEAFLGNLKTQLEKFNKTSFTTKEFDGYFKSLSQRQCI